ncbi:hypothetical protein ALC60_13594 [Trachymyrmex zeteki]|uniref:Uncharacterized protein n=1 Tax=Mycetomoellerius zeteki TaxID=64791 RepID=A0A151WHS0_9HYME|nr:hypothetical protein ALC60_13594 [Trachymyrmex zeteki]
MKRTKKMILISTENLERMQDQLRQIPTSFTDGESKEIAVSQNSDNTTSTNNTTQTPGTHLTRLDAEMSRILNSDWPRDESERWKMYKETLWRYLRFVQETRRQKDARNENVNTEDNATRDDNSDDNETTNDGVFHDLTQTSDIPSSHSISNANITKNFGISSEHNHGMKSIEKIVESVPKSYRKHARLLLKHLLQKAVPGRINWNERGIVTIEGNVVKDSNITDLINDAMRERKTVKATGRNQFARLLCALNISSALVRNKRLLSTHGVTLNSVKPQPRASSTCHVCGIIKFCPNHPRTNHELFATCRLA